MKQTLNLNSLELAPMSNLEMQQTDGGGWASWGSWLGQQLISNWDDIKKGAVDGWNSVHYN
ncbi:MAG: hypothetical protein WKI04_08850 [Ferruginibacter sp.]